MLEPMVRQRVRIRFRKQGDLRWIGHRDLMRLLQRLFRRAGLALAMSEGFHPKPRMSFPSALAVGIEGLDEILELELAENPTADELLERLQHQSVSGLDFTQVEFLPPGQKARLRTVVYTAPVREDRAAATAERIARLLAEPSWPIVRPHRQNATDLRRSIEALELRDGELRMTLRADEQGGAGPRDVLTALGLDDLEPSGACLQRTAVEVAG